MRINKGFSLIELMVVITIIWIVSIGLIIPYNFYGNIAKVKISKETVNQTLNEARNSAAWLSEFSSNKNQNTALIFKKWANSISFVSVPYDFSWSLFKKSNYKLLREIVLDDNVFINKILDNNNSGSSLSESIVYFKSPNGDREILVNENHIWLYLKIILGYKTAESWLLTKEIEIK